MAKRSAIEKNLKRRKLAKGQVNKRTELKAIIADKDVSPEERFKAVIKLSEMPRNGSKVRIRNRCRLSGRPRGTYRKFGLSRIALRELAAEGQLPGVMKSSW
jgi:small subunit ribosomal protein S14